MEKKEEQLARLFHNTYERLAPEFGYTTRGDTKQFDKNSPNGKLMVAVCREVMIEELDKAREEGKKEAFTKDEWFMLKLAMNDIFNSGNTAYEEISKKIEGYINQKPKKMKSKMKKEIIVDGVEYVRKDSIGVANTDSNTGYWNTGDWNTGVKRC